MEIDPEALDRKQAYTLLTSLIIPRPIAFVTTVDPDGRVNLAPFSFFNGISATPPIVMLSIGRRQGERKDTSRNILETGELCINASTVDLAEAVNLAAADWPSEVSEVDVCGLATEPSTAIRPPRLKDAAWALECVLHKAWELEELTTTIILARIARYHLRDDLVPEPGSGVDPTRLQPLCRLGGTQYAELGRIFSMVRPRPDPDRTPPGAR